MPFKKWDKFTITKIGNNIDYQTNNKQAERWINRKGSKSAGWNIYFVFYKNCMNKALMSSSRPKCKSTPVTDWLSNWQKKHLSWFLLLYKESFLLYFERYEANKTKNVSDRVSDWWTNSFIEELCSLKNIKLVTAHTYLFHFISQIKKSRYKRR